MFKRLKIPGLIGAILVGIILSAEVQGFSNDIDVIQTLATLGAILLLFTSGLELDPDAFFKVGKRAFFLTTLGVLISVVLGLSFGLLLGFTIQASFILGVMISPSSTAIIAQTLITTKKIETVEGETLLTAAILDDVEGVILLSIALGNWNQGGFSIINFVLTVVLAILFVFGSIFLGRKYFPKLIEDMERKIPEDITFAILLGIGLIMAFLATLLGLAAVTGGFIVGVVIPYKKVGERMDQSLTLMKDLFGVIFFVSIGLFINPLTLLAVIPIALPILGISTAGRMIGGFTGGRLGKFSGKGLWGMVSGLAVQGEVNLIIAQTAVLLGIVSPDFLAISAIVVIGSIFILLPIYQKLCRSFQ